MPRRTQAVAVKLEPVSRSTIKDIGLYTGTLNPRSQFIIAPKVSGRLERLLVNVGDRVTGNQLIAVLDNKEYLQQVDQAKAELEVAIANLEESRSALDIASRELDRVRELREKKIASESELDEAEAQFRAQTAKHKVALSQVEQRKAALRASEVRLSYTEIRTPDTTDSQQARVVGERFVDEGSMLAPNTPIVSILDISVLTAVIHVVEREYPKVEINQKADIQADAFPGRTFLGKIVRIAPLLKESSRQARVEIEIPNQDNSLKPGMFVRVNIEFDEHKNALVIPISALVKRNDTQGVFLVDTMGKKARYVPLTLGITSGDLVEVLDPPITGSVVVMGQHLLEDGSEIFTPGQAPETARAKGKTFQRPK